VSRILLPFSAGKPGARAFDAFLKTFNDVRTPSLFSYTVPLTKFEGFRRLSTPPLSSSCLYLRWLMTPMSWRDVRVQGCLVRVTGDTIALSPPLIIDKAQIDQLISTLGKAIKDTA
jgi:hypothetical protein